MKEANPGSFTSDIKPFYNKGDAINDAIPLIRSDNPDNRAHGWKILRSRFTGPKTARIYNAARENKE
jgi:hypothetical protein